MYDMYEKREIDIEKIVCGLLFVFGSMIGLCIFHYELKIDYSINGVIYLASFIYFMFIFCMFMGFWLLYDELKKT